MNISLLNPEDEATFNRLAHTHGTIFNGIEWTNMFCNSMYRYGIYDKGDRLIGGFVLFKERKFGLSMFINPPFTPGIGPFIEVEASNPVSIMDTWKKVLTQINELIEKLQYSIVSISLNKNIIDMQPFIWGKFKVIPGYTYILDLSFSLEEILKRMSNERRKNINKGLKDGLIVNRITDYKIVKSLVVKTFSRQEKKIKESYLNKILFEFASNENSFAFATFREEQPIACCFCVNDSHTAYYILGGYDNESKHHGAGALSMWESIKYAKNIGLRHFDFEGSMIPQIERYFRGFGGQLTPYFRINKASLPLELLLKFFKREIF